MGKIITSTFKVENMYQEHKLWNHLESLNPVKLQVFPDNSAYKENPEYKKLRKAKRQAENNLYNFTDKKK